MVQPEDDEQNGQPQAKAGKRRPKASKKPRKGRLGVARVVKMLFGQKDRPVFPHFLSNGL
jgi:hypothetical protein